MAPEKTDNSLFMPQREKCPLCGGRRIRRGIHRIDSWEIKFSVSRCLECAFIFMDPPLKNTAAESLYTDTYYTGQSNYSYCDERQIRPYAAYVWDSRVRVIRSYVKEGNFLDVGSSFGGLLESASEYFTAHGIELSEYSSSECSKTHPFFIHRGTLEDHPFESNFFSAITMIEVIEHIAEPRRALEECARLLKAGGLLVIQTANMNSLQALMRGKNYAYYMPGHLSYFSAGNLSRVLRNAGFGRIKFFFPVEFGLLPKLLKSRGSYRKAADYAGWLKIISYHLRSKFHFKNFGATASMVVYAFKDGKK